MEISKKYSLPMQALVGVMFLAQLFVIFIILYLRRDFHFELDAATGLFGWIMLISTVILSIWNIVLLIGRKRNLNKISDEDARKQIFQSATYARYFTLIGIVLIGVAFSFITENLYYFVFIVFSFIWQVAIFPSRTSINAILSTGIPEKQETPVEQKEDNGSESQQTETSKSENSETI